MRLSPEAWAKIQEFHASYLGDLGTEAVRIARRSGVRTVDESHVIDSHKRIAVPSRRSAWATVLFGLGGMVLGVGLTTMYGLKFNPGEHTINEALVAMAIVIAGAIPFLVSATMLVKNKQP
jgi:hypothetical protein